MFPREQLKENKICQNGGFKAAQEALEVIEGRFCQKPRRSVFSCLHKSCTFYRDVLTPRFLCARLELFGYISTCTLPGTCRPQAPYVKDVRIISLIIPHTFRKCLWRMGGRARWFSCTKKHVLHAAAPIIQRFHLRADGDPHSPEARHLGSVYCQFLNVMGLEMTLGSQRSHEGSAVCHAVFL